MGFDNTSNRSNTIDLLLVLIKLEVVKNSIESFGCSDRRTFENRNYDYNHRIILIKNLAEAKFKKQSNLEGSYAAYTLLETNLHHQFHQSNLIPALAQRRNMCRSP